MADKEIKIDPDFRRGGVCTFVSWERLEGLLRAAGEITDNESIRGYRFEDHGFAYYIKKADYNE